MQFNIDWGMHLLLKLVETEDFHTVLDIGSGAGEHKRFLEYQGKEVKTVDFDKEADYRGDFMEIDFSEKFDCIWCSHVLEHQRNVGLFLEKALSLLKEDGVLAIAVPCHPQDRLVAGHLTAWSVLLLCYNLILAGQDCREAKIYKYYELSLLVKKRKIDVPGNFKNSLIGEYGFEYFPLKVQSGSEISQHGKINWGDLLPKMPMEAVIYNSITNEEINC